MWHNDPEKYRYSSDNIIVGKAELTYISEGKTIGWAIPGGHIITDFEKAKHYAQRLNKVILVNLKKR